MSKGYNYIGVFCVAVCLLLACQSEPYLYEKTYELPISGWHSDSILRFEFRLTDSGRYDLYYHIRNTLDYPYYNLYVKYRLIDSTGRQLDERLQDIILMDAKTGEPFGTHLGGSFEHELIALPAYAFVAPGRYVLLIEQYMRQERLPGILNFGLRLKAAKPTPTNESG